MKKQNIQLINDYFKFLEENNMNNSIFISSEDLKDIATRYEKLTEKEKNVLKLKKYELEKEIQDKVFFIKFNNENPYNFLIDIKFENKIFMYKNLHKYIFDIFYGIMISHGYTEESLINLLCNEYYYNEDEHNYIGILKGIQGYKIKRYEEKIINFEQIYKEQELKGKKNKEYYCNLRGKINHLIKCKNELTIKYETVSHYLGKYKLRIKLNKLQTKNKTKVNKI